MAGSRAGRLADPHAGGDGILIADADQPPDAMNTPDIQTAVPVRRYAIGDFSAVLLGEVQTRDPTTYHFILAVVPDGSSSPVLYLTSEPASAIEGGGETIVRVIAESGERTFGPEPRWRDLESFAGDALAMVQKVLRLEGEEVRRLL